MSVNKLIGNSPELERSLHAARLAAYVDAPVMIMGESGSGRTMLARAVHLNSHRREQPILRISFGVLFDESGNDKVEQAGGGTLLLAEVDRLDSETQIALLEILEKGELQQRDIRLVATASKELDDKLADSTFLDALFYSLNVVRIDNASLSERTGDLKLLLNHYIQYYAARYKRSAPRFSASAMQMLKKYRWPGNVRELRNLCERMAILLPGKEIAPENLPAEIRSPAPRVAVPGFILPDKGIQMDLLEQDLIRQALDKAEGNRSRAARLLGISRDTLNYRLKKFAL